MIVPRLFIPNQKGYRANAVSLCLFQYIAFKLFLEVSVVHTLESSAVTGFVLRHLVYSVVDSVVTQLLSALSQLEFALASAVLCHVSQLKVLSGRVGNYLAQQLCELSRVLSLFVSSLFVVQTNFG